MHRNKRLAAALLVGTLGIAASVMPATAATKKTVPTKKAPTKTATLKDIVETAVGAGSFKTLAAALTAADLVSTLKGPGPFTVFAPTDAAFAKIPKADLDAILADKRKLTEILTYHVVAGSVPASAVVTLGGKSAKTVNGAEVKIGVSGGKVTLNGNVNVTAVDVKASNGIIHVIDTVLLPQAAPAPATTIAPLKDIVDTPPVSGGRTIVDVATSNGSFKTLLASIDAAGLTTTLKSAGPFTVFAPNDHAFAVLPQETIATLLKPENKKALTDILTYHVTPGKLSAAQVLASIELPTVNGKKSKIVLVNGRPFINGAAIKITDIETSNGVIHVIDTVMLP